MERRGKCCGTCLWCYTEEDELETYEDEELNIITVGDCLMGMKNFHKNLPYCQSYDALPELETNYIIYDETYLGPGFFIVNEIDGEVQRFLKIYISNKEGEPFYKIRAYELTKNPNEKSNKIRFNLSCYLNKDLFKIIKELKEKLNIQKIISIDKLHDKNSFIEINIENDAALLTVEKSNNENNFIDISIGNNYSSNYYEIINEFYEELFLLINDKKSNIIKNLKIR